MNRRLLTTSPIQLETTSQTIHPEQSDWFLYDPFFIHVDLAAFWTAHDDQIARIRSSIAVFEEGGISDNIYQPQSHLPLIWQPEIPNATSSISTVKQPDNTNQGTNEGMVTITKPSPVNEELLGKIPENDWSECPDIGFFFRNVNPADAKDTSKSTTPTKLPTNADEILFAEQDNCLSNFIDDYIAVCMEYTSFQPDFVGSYIVSCIEDASSEYIFEGFDLAQYTNNYIIVGF